MPEIIRYYCPKGHWLGQTASVNEDPPVSCYCEGCDLTYGRHGFDERVVDIPDQRSDDQSITVALEALKLKHYVCDGDCWFSCPKSGECCNDETEGDPCNCGADEHNQKVDALIQRLKDII